MIMACQALAVILLFRRKLNVMERLLAAAVDVIVSDLTGRKSFTQGSRGK